MAAPSGTQWGQIVGGYGRLGLYVSTSNTNTATTFTFQVWFWSKYSVSDSSNTLCFDIYKTSGAASTSLGSVNVSTTVSSGEGWSTSNQVLLKTITKTYNKGTSASTYYACALLKDIDRVGDNMPAVVEFTIPKLAWYTVAYNANGGSGAPGSQTKWYGKALTLSTAKPTRTGFTFQGWATSANGGVAYASGASYTTNAGATLYAVWKANTYTVTYNANGGTGAPSNQTKTHGTNLTLSSAKPTRANYNFKGWGTSASATTVAYQAGASYTANATITLYAIWEVAYVKPRIFNLSATRCTAAGIDSEEGTKVCVRFEWESDNPLQRLKISWGDSDSECWYDEDYATDCHDDGCTGDQYARILETEFSPDSSYTITVTIWDGESDSQSNSAVTTLPGAVFPIDVLAGGKGVSFGKPAEKEGVADFGFDAKFNKPVYGKALGMDRLPAIPEGADFNDYMEPGCYAVHGNAIAETCLNCPVDRAGRLEVWSATGEGVRTEQWSYLRQRYIPYNSTNAVWEREITRGPDNIWKYYDWWRSTLTPTAAEKVYSKAAITIALGDSIVLGKVNIYTQIPLDTKVVSTSNRLTLESNSIRIGANISHVKVSGLALVKFGTIVGNRHVRIQKVSGATTTSIAWACVYGAAGSNTPYALPSIIVPVKEGDLLRMVFYTSDAADQNASGSAANGWQTYLTAEEI